MSSFCHLDVTHLAHAWERPNSMIKISELDQELGKMIKRRRQRRRLTQMQLAQVSGVTRTYISELERGIKDPSIFILFKLAGALKLKPSVLIDDVEHHLADPSKSHL